MRRSVLVGACAAAMWSAPLSAQDVTTVQDMLPGCETALNLAAAVPGTAEWEAGLYCLGVAMGAMTVMGLNCGTATHLGLAPYPSLTSEAPPSTSAAVQAFVNRARANPQIWGDHFATSMIGAIASAFPCQAGQ